MSEPPVDPLDPLEGLPAHLRPQEAWYESYLRFGLYVGAAFQLLCLLAVVCLPPLKPNEDKSTENAFWRGDDDAHVGD